MWKKRWIVLCTGWGDEDCAAGSACWTTAVASTPTRIHGRGNDPPNCVRRRRRASVLKGALVRRANFGEVIGYVARDDSRQHDVAKPVPAGRPHRVADNFEAAGGRGLRDVVLTRIIASDIANDLAEIGAAHKLSLIHI